METWSLAQSTDAAQQVLTTIERLSKVTDGQLPQLEARAQREGFPVGWFTEYVALARSYKAGTITPEELCKRVAHLIASIKQPQA